jgi:hypothetical protein
MHYERMSELIEREFDAIRELRATKGLEYAGELDTLADFKDVAEETGTTPFQVWATYVKKHQRAIDTFIREGGVKSESIESRIRDVVVYHLLLLGLIEDESPVAEADTMMRVVVQPGTFCNAMHTLGDAVGEQHHMGEVVKCELDQGHPGRHYGRTDEGHGFIWGAGA